MLGNTYLFQMLYNTKDKTYHPIAFRNFPLPGEAIGITRYKSAGHHTNGFASRNAALNYIDEVEKKATVIRELEKDVEWNGEGIPAMVILR